MPGGSTCTLPSCRSSYVAPFAKEGGVADVAGSVPKALAALGYNVRIAVPRYGTISPERWNLKHTGVTRAVYLGNVDERVDLLQSSLPDSLVTVYFLEHEGLFGRHRRIYLGQDQWAEQRRFVLFCRGLVECLPALAV